MHLNIKREGKMIKRAIALLVAFVFVVSCAPMAFSATSNQEYAEYTAQMKQFSDQMKKSRSDFRQQMRDFRDTYAQKMRQADGDKAAREALVEERRQERIKLVEAYRAEQEQIREQVLQVKGDMSKVRNQKADAGEKDWKQLKAAAKMKGASRTK
jgi:hypothetical protein